MMARSNIRINTVLNIVKTCITLAFPLITFPYISRALLPENIGKISFAQSIVSYFMMIATLGIQTYAIRMCAIYRDEKDKLEDIASQLYTINIITTFVAYFALTITLLFYSSIHDYRTLIVIQSTTILFTTLGADWLNSAMEDFFFITLRTVFFQILSIILMFIFIHSPDDYLKYVAISVLSASGANIINIFYRKKYCTLKLNFNISWKTHLPPIIFLFVMTLSQTIFSNADVTMIGLMKDNLQVGLYSTAHKVEIVLSQIISSLAFVIIPRLSKYYAENNFLEANKLLKKILSFNLTLGLPIFVGAVILANEIVYFVGGESYVNAVPILRVLMISFCFSLIGGSFLGNAVFISMGKEKYYMVVCCVTAVINIVLNAILIPMFSAIGAAIATAINGFLIMLLLLLKVDKRISIDNKIETFAKPLIGCVSIVMCCGVCHFISNIILRTFLSVSLSVFVYGLVEILLRNDIVIDSLRDLLKKIKRSK